MSCEISDCSEEKVSNSSYCHYHNELYGIDETLSCTYLACDKKIDKGISCEEHMCNVVNNFGEKCPNPKTSTPNSFFCRNHECSFKIDNPSFSCNKRSVENGNACIFHLCIIHKCLNVYIIDSCYCNQHHYKKIGYPTKIKEIFINNKSMLLEEFY